MSKFSWFWSGWLINGSLNAAVDREPWFVVACLVLLLSFVCWELLAAHHKEGETR